MRFNLYAALLLLAHLVATPSARAQYEVYYETEPWAQFEIAFRDDYPLRLPLGLAVGVLDSNLAYYDDDLARSIITRANGRISLDYIDGSPGEWQYLESYDCPIEPPRDGRDTCTYRFFDIDSDGNVGRDYNESDTTIRLFSGGLLDSQLIRNNSVRVFGADTITNTSAGRIVFGYDASGRRTSREAYWSDDTDPTVMTLSERATLTYDSEGRLTRQVEAYRLDQGQDSSMTVMEYSFTENRANYEILYRSGYRESGYYTAVGGELDSLTYRDHDDDPYVVVIVRADDGRDPRFRRYLVTGDAIATLEYYYAEPISSAVAEAPVVPGHLIAANPLAAGAAVRLEGLPAGAHLELVDAQGRLVAREVVADGAAAFAWPVLPQGVYLVVARAEGHQARAWRIVQQ